MAYFECEATTRFDKFIADEVACDLQPVLSNLCRLFGLWSLEKHMAILYEARYFAPTFPALSSVHEQLLELCSKLKDDAVSLVDVFAPPDFILNSCLGFADGRVYEHIFDAMIQSEGSFERPDWLLSEFEQKPEVRQSVAVDAIRSKL